MKTEKIGRNDPCFCGSGKKHKFCCMGKDAAAPPTPDVPFATVAEDFALRTLLATSKPFRATYDGERPKIGDPIFWTSQLLMPHNLAAQAIRLPQSDIQTIYVRRVPAPAQDARVVAHELLHLVLDAEGFPFVVELSEHQPLAALLNSLAQDPVIDGRLRQFGFDATASVLHEIKSARAQLQQAQPPIGQVAQATWTLTYAGQLLAWKAAAPDRAGAEIEAFRGWFAARYPAVAAAGDELLSTVARVGFDTPLRMRALFEHVIHQHQQTAQFVVRSRH